MAATGPGTLAFGIHSPISREDLPGLCDRVCGLLAGSGAGRVVCDAAGAEPDAVTVDALARLQIAANRYGCRIELRHASGDLQRLIRFMGLEDVVPEPGPPTR